VSAFQRNDSKDYAIDPPRHAHHRTPRFNTIRADFRGAARDQHFSPNKLPTKASNPGVIQNGDLMIYGPDTLVLFYKSFSTSYGYTRLGRINDPSILAAALGSGDVTITYELQEKPKGN
jgi:hypothetical protein